MMQVPKPGQKAAKKKDPTLTAAHIAGLYAIAAAVIGAVVAAFFTNGFGLAKSTSGATPAPSTSATTSAPTASSAPTQSGGAATKGTWTEIADVSTGVPVFTNNTGTAANTSEIPIGQHVQVRCHAPNYSGISSINAFYLLETPPWRGDYASANSFANGAQVGDGDGNAIDPKVPACPSAS